MSNNDWYLTLLSAPIPTILRGLQFTPLWLGADTPSRKNRCMRWCIDLDVHILCTRMCDVSDYSLKIYQLQYTSYCHYCNSPPWSRVDTWSRLSSACTIWLCHRLLWCASRCFSGMQMKSMRLTHLSIWAITSVIYSVQVRIIHLSGTCPARRGNDRYVDDVDVLLSSALYLLHYTFCRDTRFPSIMITPSMVAGHRLSYWFVN